MKTLYTYFYLLLLALSMEVNASTELIGDIKTTISNIFEIPTESLCLLNAIDQNESYVSVQVYTYGNWIIKVPEIEVSGDNISNEELQSIQKHLRELEQLEKKQYHGIAHLFDLNYGGIVYNIKSVFPECVFAYDYVAGKLLTKVFNLGDDTQKDCFMAVEELSSGAILIQKQPFAPGQTLFDMLNENLAVQNFSRLEELEGLYANIIINVKNNGYDHRDLHGGNIIIDKSDISLIDWSGARGVEDADMSNQFIFTSTILNKDAQEKVLSQLFSSSYEQIAPSVRFFHRCRDWFSGFPLWITDFSEKFQIDTHDSGFAPLIDCSKLDMDKFDFMKFLVKLCANWIARYVDNRRDDDIFHKEILPKEVFFIPENISNCFMTLNQAYLELNMALCCLIGFNPFVGESYDRTRVSEVIHRDLYGVLLNYLDPKAMAQLQKATLFLEVLLNESSTFQQLQDSITSCATPALINQLILIKYFEITSGSLA